MEKVKLAMFGQHVLMCLQFGSKGTIWITELVVPLPSWARNPGCKMLFKDVEDRTGCQGICVWASLVPLFGKAKISGFPISFHFNVERVFLQSSYRTSS